VIYLRVSAAVVLALFPAFLVAGDIPLKLSLLGLLGFFNAGWYAILKGQLYTAMPGQSGTAMSVYALAGLVHHLIPLGIGLAAQQVGLGSAMWLLILGPAALLVGLPFRAATWQRSEKRL
jgi:FSR family fosmidomycin resistance protein-like MFS transporter